MIAVLVRGEDDSVPFRFGEGDWNKRWHCWRISSHYRHHFGNRNWNSPSKGELFA